MPSNGLTVCLDSNIYISAIGFGGNPATILRLAIKREFLLITSPSIFEEVKRNLLVKLELPPKRVEKLIRDIEEVSTLFVPTGKLKITGYQPDDEVLEAALIGGADVLVTGDKRHLLPLKKFETIVIESPAIFLRRFNI